MGPVVAVNPPLPSRKVEDYRSPARELLTVFDMSAPVDTSLAAQALGRLTKFQPKDADLKQRQSEKVFELMNAFQSYEELVEELTADRAASFKERHEEVKSRARAQRREVARLEGAALQLRKDVYSAEATRDRLGNQVAQAKDRLARVDRFASAKHIASLHHAIREAEQKWSVAENEYGRAINFYNQSERDVVEARKVMSQIEAEETSVRHEIDGVPYYDTEFGLLVTPQV
jgi:chromosome segregation ATPase